LRQSAGDGNCLFGAVLLQVYGDASAHAKVRRRCLDFIEAKAKAEHYPNFVAGDRPSSPKDEDNNNKGNN
jgi:hypothetical protein